MCLKNSKTLDRIYLTLLSSTVSARKSVQQLVLKIRRNERNLGLHIILKGRQILKRTGYANSTRLSSGLRPQASTSTPAAPLMNCEVFLTKGYLYHIYSEGKGVGLTVVIGYQINKRTS